jgi:exopolysaccharide biosynthesis polyprenyl glycosylphosphotransferase
MSLKLNLNHKNISRIFIESRVFYQQRYGLSIFMLVLLAACVGNFVFYLGCFIAVSKGGEYVRLDEITVNDKEYAAIKTFQQSEFQVDEKAMIRVSSNICKRMIDVAVSSIALIVLVPLYLLAALLIKLDSTGPAVFRQKRVGKKGKEFTLYKLRSMRVNSDAQVHKDYMERLIRNGDNGLRGDSGCYKLERDCRITRLGRFLRKTSMDELPQIVNVLKGEMSLVGPRPALPYEVEMYKSWHANRLLIRPGITGLWQVSGRSEKNFDEMVELDIAYIKNWSLLLDLKILLKTVFVVIERQGAW